jgi:hypothetical protein
MARVTGRRIPEDLSVVGFTTCRSPQPAAANVARQPSSRCAPSVDGRRLDGSVDGTEAGGLIGIRADRYSGATTSGGMLA